MPIAAQVASWPVRNVTAGGLAELFERAREAEDDANPLLSPKVSSHEGRLVGGALELLSADPALTLGIPPGRRTAGGRDAP